MTTDNSKTTDHTGEVHKAEKPADDGLKTARTADGRLFDKQKAMEAQNFSVSDIDTQAVRDANAAAKNSFQLVDGTDVLAARTKPSGDTKPGATAVASKDTAGQQTQDGPTKYSDTQVKPTDTQVKPTDTQVKPNDSPVPPATVKPPPDAETAKRFETIAQASPEAKRLTDDCLDKLNPVQQKQFLSTLEIFQKRKDLPQAEKDKVYGQLGRLLEAKDTKLPRGEKDSPDELRIVLAEQLMYHAAHPHRLDQGDFNTCNVTCVAERLLTRCPSMAAEIAVTTALTGEWVNPKDHKIIKLDLASLIPAKKDSTRVVPEDGERSFDTQILNVVMVNDATQREVPPRQYRQESRSTSTSTEQHSVNGEALYNWDPVHNKCLGRVTETITRDGKKMTVNVDKPDITSKQISDIGTRLTGESHYLIVADGAKIDPKTHKPKDDGLVHVTSQKQLEDALKEMKRLNRLPAIILVDAHNPLFERLRTFPPGSFHVVSIRDYHEENGIGRVQISNQWGAEDDISANAGDLYDCCKYNKLPETSRQYQLTKNRVLNSGSIKKDFDT